MPKDPHQKAAEQHEQTAKAHRTAAEQHGSNDHVSAKQQSAHCLLYTSTVTLAKETITSFVLILHELGTNALKYGAWKVGVEGVISVRWQILEAGELDFHWRETGVSLFLPPVREG